jgi:hypothetical protein
MVIHKCETCHKEFNIKRLYNNHLLRKNPCKPELDNICIYCNNNYSNKSNLNKHLNICKKNTTNSNNKTTIDELKELIKQELKKDTEELKKKVDEQQKKIEELTQLTESNHNIINNQPSSTNITLNDNSVTNNTTNNIINIFSVGKEDLSRLSKEEIIKICTSGTYYPLVAAEIIHCNEKYPEFQNFMISNLRSNTGLILINDKWVTKSQDEILSTLLKVDKNHVSTLMKDLEVEDKLKIKLESTKDEIDTNECKEHMKEKIKNKLHSASKMISKNKKKLEKVIDNK